MQNMMCTCHAMAAFYVTMEVRDLLASWLELSLCYGERKKVEKSKFERMNMVTRTQRLKNKLRHQHQLACVILLFKFGYVMLHWDEVNV